jgi:hypothetical protein
MKKRNDEERLMINDIIHKKHKYPSKSLHIFLIEGVGVGKIFTLMCIIQNMLRYYIKNFQMLTLKKPKIMKLTCTRKSVFNINGMTIHLTFAIPFNKKINELKALSDEKI